MRYRRENYQDVPVGDQIECLLESRIAARFSDVAERNLPARFAPL